MLLEITDCLLFLQTFTVLNIIDLSSTIDISSSFIINWVICVCTHLGKKLDEILTWWSAWTLSEICNILVKLYWKPPVCYGDLVYRETLTFIV